MSTTTEPRTSCRIAITGMDCADCAKTIERSLNTMEGVESAEVNFGLGRADVSYEPTLVDESTLRERIRSLGYQPREEQTSPDGGEWLFDIGGMDCGECALTVERGVARLPGVAAAAVSFAGATLKVQPADARLTRGAVINAVSSAGYSAIPRGTADLRTQQEWWRQRRVQEIGVAAALWVVGFAVEHLGGSALFYATPFLMALIIAGYPVARAALFALRARRLDMNVLMTLAAVGAIAIGEWDEGASVLILFAIGLSLQSLTLERTRAAIRGLLDLAPREARLRRNGEETRIPVERVVVGDELVVQPGERIPVDGQVVSGQSFVDQSQVTGESTPIEAEPGTAVFAASLNGDGSLVIRAEKPASDSALANIIQLVERAQGSRAPAQAFVDRFSAIYTPVVVGLAVLLATAVPVIAGGWHDWFFRALVLLVVACPCALVISTPVALVAAIGSASQRGVLFKGGAALEALAGVRTIAFDKTGTLTRGTPAVEEVIPLGSLDADGVLSLAAAAERESTHPIASGIVEAARKAAIWLPRSDASASIPGRGAKAVVNGETVTVGSSRLFDGLPESIQSRVDQIESRGQTAVIVQAGSEFVGLIALADPIRREAVAALAAVHKLGVRTAMLSGDNQIVAAKIAREVGVNDVRAQLMPGDKAAAIEQLRGIGAIAMVGDGVNDAPALAAADCGIAMGAIGSDVAIEAADIALMSDDLSRLPFALSLARRTLATIRQNVAFSIVTKVAFLVLTAFGVTNLWLAVIADMGTSLLVTLNSARLTTVGWRAAREDGPRGHGAHEDGHEHAHMPEVDESSAAD